MTKMKKSVTGWTFKENLIEPNISNLNFYSNQPTFQDGVADDSFIKVRITIEEV